MLRYRVRQKMQANIEQLQRRFKMFKEQKFVDAGLSSTQVSDGTGLSKWVRSVLARDTRLIVRMIVLKVKISKDTIGIGTKHKKQFCRAGAQEHF